MRPPPVFPATSLPDHHVLHSLIDGVNFNSRTSRLQADSRALRVSRMSSERISSSMVRANSSGARGAFGHESMSLARRSATI
jgi:hypothetical protein